VKQKFHVLLFCQTHRSIWQKQEQENQSQQILPSTDEAFDPEKYQ